VLPRVLPVKGESDAGLFVNSGIDPLKARTNLLEGYRLL
jgi:hypothetical protein